MKSRAITATTLRFRTDNMRRRRKEPSVKTLPSYDHFRITALDTVTPLLPVQWMIKGRNELDQATMVGAVDWTDSCADPASAFESECANWSGSLAIDCPAKIICSSQGLLFSRRLIPPQIPTIPHAIPELDSLGSCNVPMCQ